MIAPVVVALGLLAGSHEDRVTGRRVNNFLNSYTLMQTATDTSFIAIMAVGATLVIVSGGIDLSVGSIYALSGVLTTLAPRGLPADSGWCVAGCGKAPAGKSAAGAPNGAGGAGKGKANRLTIYHAETPQDAAAEVLRAMRAYPEVNAWAMIGGWPPFTQTLLTDLAPAKVKVVSVDELPPELPYVAKGIVPVLLAQPTHLRGYVAVEKIVEKVHLKRHGLVPGMTVRENVTLPFVQRLSRWGWVDRRREAALVGGYCQRLNVRTPSLDAPVAGLSGGNQQKLVIARWLAADGGILLVDEPTRGVDVGAKGKIHGLIDRLAASGAGVLLISSELPELLNLASRIVVLRAGRVVAELRRAEATQETLVRHMAGLK